MKLLGAIVLTIAFLQSPAAARCLTYEPTTVTLIGELTSKTVPGPPNYVSIARGDLPEKIFILELAEPVCVSADPSSRQNSKSHAGVDEVQLSVPAEKARAYVGRRVRASGALFGARTGHHRTPVLLRVAKLGAL
jgi:hypothetical protein